MVDESNDALSRAHSAIACCPHWVERRSLEVSHGRTDPTATLAALADLRRQASQPGRPTRLSAADQLALASAQADLAAMQNARHVRGMQVLVSALEACQEAGSVATLADEAPMHATRLGFERALFSWVRDGWWIPRSARIGDDPKGGEPYVALSAPPYVEMGSCIEERALRARLPILVSDAVTNPGVHRRLHGINRADAYIAAPVVSSGAVRAFIHVSTQRDTGTVDELDVPLVAAFARGLGTALDLAALRHHVDAGEPAAPASSSLETLSEREQQVLTLLAEGLTNKQIGERLFVSAETVKTHVRRLMHKLGADTRTQAVGHLHPASTSARRSVDQLDTPAP